MIIFYPRDIELWRSEYNFTPDITLVPKDKTNHKFFYDRNEFIEYLKSHGIQLTDPKNPLIFSLTNHHIFGYVHSVVQWTLLGWIKEV